jgi:hypothetical protein
MGLHARLSPRRWHTPDNQPRVAQLVLSCCVSKSFYEYT